MGPVANGTHQILDEVLERHHRGHPVIGGGEIYRQALSMANTVYLTRVHANPAGDTFMPDLPSSDWIEVGRETLVPDPADEFPATLVTLRRTA